MRMVHSHPKAPQFAVSPVSLLTLLVFFCSMIEIVFLVVLRLRRRSLRFFSAASSHFRKKGAAQKWHSRGSTLTITLPVTHTTRLRSQKSQSIPAEGGLATGLVKASKMKPTSSTGWRLPPMVALLVKHANHQPFFVSRLTS